MSASGAVSTWGQRGAEPRRQGDTARTEVRAEENLAALKGTGAPTLLSCHGARAEPAWILCLQLV